MKKTVLVAGGAGYIGSHMCKYLFNNGYTPMVLDNLAFGHRQAVKWGPLFQGSIDDKELLTRLFSQYKVAAVMHFAAFARVGESVENPGKYYANNVAATLTLLEAMKDCNVPNFIFSSSCSVYGEPEKNPIDENHSLRPISPYGKTKLMVEQILDDYDNAYGLKSICLRYFNAAGADPEGELGEDHRPETHLIPIVLETALGKRDHINIFGDKYPTKDGTCIRDYIHVTDLAAAHLLALEKLLDGGSSEKYNLGNQKGFTVKEVIEKARRITGKPIPEKITGPRPGDPPALIGSCEKAIKELGWETKFSDLDTIINTAWKWHKNNPDGYGS